MWYISISYIFIFLYFKLLIMPIIVKSYYVTVDIDKDAKNSDMTHMITNKKTTELCPDGYSKYIAERQDCFSVSGVRFAGESVLINGNEIVLHYVYAIESYWKHNTPLMIRFIKYHGWYTRAYPAYVRIGSGGWKEDNTYYYDKELTRGNLRILLDDIAVRAKQIIEDDKARSRGGSKEDEEGQKREFRLFEEDKLKEKKSGFMISTLPYFLFFLQMLYTLLSR